LFLLFFVFFFPPKNKEKFILKKFVLADFLFPIPVFMQQAEYDETFTF